MMLRDVAILGPVPNVRKFIAHKHCANYICILIATSSSRAQLVRVRKKGRPDGILKRGTVLKLES